MSDNKPQLELAEKIAEACVLCIGDVMLDRFITGEVERISPEAPIPILRIENEKTMLGGAGNVARYISGLGGEVRDRKSTRLNSRHITISYAVFCLKKKNRTIRYTWWTGGEGTDA